MRTIYLPSATPAAARQVLLPAQIGSGAKASRGEQMLAPFRFHRVYAAGLHVNAPARFRWSNLHSSRIRYRRASGESQTQLLSA
jgi:hypothetical protein